MNSLIYCVVLTEHLSNFSEAYSTSRARVHPSMPYYSKSPFPLSLLNYSSDANPLNACTKFTIFFHPIPLKSIYAFLQLSIVRCVSQAYPSYRRLFKLLKGLKSGLDCIVKELSLEEVDEDPLFVLRLIRKAYFSMLSQTSLWAWMSLVSTFCLQPKGQNLSANLQVLVSC